MIFYNVFYCGKTRIKTIRGFSARTNIPRSAHLNHHSGSKERTGVTEGEQRQLAVKTLPWSWREGLKAVVVSSKRLHRASRAQK